MSGEGAPVGDEQATRGAVTASHNARRRDRGRKKLKKGEESLEEQKREFAEEVEKVLREFTVAAEAAAKVKVAAETDRTEAAEILRVARAERAALDAEKAAMCALQTSKIKLDVGGHSFTTSLPTLTSVPDTYLAALFSGRHPLAPDVEGAFAFFIDRNGDHFRHILSYMRDPGRDE